MLSFNAFSQTDTGVYLETPVAREVIKDLLSGDAAKQELAQTKLLIQQLEEKTDLQQKSINVLLDKSSTYDSILALKDEQFILQQRISSDLQKSLKVQKRKSTFFTITTIAGGVLAVTALTQ